MTATPLSPAILNSLLATHPHSSHWIVAYSGGLDSHVLLHLLASNRACWSGRTLAAVYVDHGLQAASAYWGAHCAQICRALKIPFRMLRIDARPAPGESPEAAARRTRYAALAIELNADTALLTAHHRDDQAETLLLQLLRGAGPHGLAAMPTASRLGPGWLLRPLLNVDRADILTYAREHGLQWIEDTSNTNTDFDRNYLRHRILPPLRERWPALSRNLARSASLCAETADWLDMEADADLAQVVAQRPDSLSLSALRELSELRQRNVLRRWLRQLGLTVPDHRQLRQLLRDMLHAGHDRQPLVRWRGGEMRRYQDRLYAMSPLPSHDAQQTWIWRATTKGWPPLELPGLGWLEMHATVGAGLRTELLANGVLWVRFRQGGERFRPAGRAHHQELKKLLQEASIPPWERDRLPLIYRPPCSGPDSVGNPDLLAVVGLGITATAQSGESGLLPVLQSPSAMSSGIL